MTNKKKKKPILKPAKPVGRPSSLTPETIIKLEQAFAIGLKDVEALAYAGVSSSAFYAYCQKNPEFQERKEELKLKPILKAKNTIFRNLDDEAVARWYLERKCKDEFSTKEVKELVGADGADLNFVVTIVDNDKH